MKEKKTIIKPVSIASVCILAVSTLIFTVQAFEDKPDGKVQETTTAVTTVAEETTAEVTTTVTTVTELPKTSITTGVTTVSTAETTSVTELTTEPVTEPTTEPTTEPMPEPTPEPTPETVTEPVPEPVPEPTPTPEFIVYKETTHYVHRSTCRWYNPDVCREITSTEGLEARLCTECNPDIEIITPYVEPTPVEPAPVEPAPEASAPEASAPETPAIGSYVGTYSATAYTHTGNPCASGTYPYVAKWIDGVCYRTVAADYNFSLGQKLYIEAGDYTGYVIVEDRGGFGYGVIDIFMDSYNECINWGRRNIEVYYVN